MRPEHPPRGLMAVMALLGMALQFSGDLLYTSLALLVWLLGLLAFYPCVLRRMWMPRFWAVTLLVALGSGLLLGQRDQLLWGVAISTQGLSAGALMVVRGAFIFGLLAWASKALAHSGLERLASKFGAQRLAVSTGIAIELLPEIAGRIQKLHSRQDRHGGDSRWRSAYLSAANLLADCAMMADDMVRKSPSPSLVVITGSVGSGKTHTARSLAGQLKKRGLLVGGVIQPKHENGSSYLLEDLATGRQWEFASFDLHRAEGKTGYRFRKEGWSIAAKSLKQACRHMDVVFVDELGLLEAEGKGHWPAFRHGIDNGLAKLWVLVVRKDRLDSLAPRLGPVERTIKIPLEENISDLASSLLDKIHPETETEGQSGKE